MGWFGGGGGGGGGGFTGAIGVGGTNGGGSPTRFTNYNKNWSPFGLGGSGKPGSLGKWDVLGNALDKQNPFQYDSDGAKDKIASLREGQSNDTRGVLDQMKTDDSDYYSRMSGVDRNYRNELGGLSKEANQQATDARKVYSGTVQPNQKSMMEDARKEAGDAMTLQQAGDPNNSVHQAVRGMYDQQAQGITRQGQTDAGVLSALGAQAFAGQAGNVPMTGGQMSALAGQNMSQAGQAFARAQQRANDVKMQGIDRGFAESDRQYQRGQGAKDRYAGSVKDIQDSSTRNSLEQASYRSERKGYSSDKAGSAAGLAGLQYGQRQGQAGRELGWINDKYGGPLSDLGGEMAQNNAAKAGVTGVVGTVLGGIAGGAGGAKAGGATGQAVGGGGGAGGGGGVGNYQQGGVQGNMQPTYGYNDGGGAYGGAQGGGYNYGYGGGGYPARPQ